MKNKIPVSKEKAFVNATAPIKGGKAPGIAPIKTAQGDTRFIGVYMKA